ncbi:MAG: AAA family ATPase [Lutisporaceae bacterium]
MSTISIVIVDENQIYTKALSEYLQDEYGQAFEISCFTGIKSLEEYLVNKHNTDIMLIDKHLYNDSLKIFKVKTTLILTDDSQESELNGELTLYKFQLGDKLAKCILQNYDSLESKQFSIHTKSTEAKLITVYSPTGGSGKSTIAYNISRQYAIQGKKTLLISMESYTALPIFKSESKNRGLSYLMYLIKNKANNLQVKLDAIKVQDTNTNIHYIPRDNNSLEYKDICIEDIAVLQKFLKSQSGYDAVIFDMDSSVCENTLSMFKYCDVILCVVASDIVSREKHESFEKQLELFNNLLNVNLNDKIIIVNNKATSQHSDNKRDFSSSINIANIPYLKESTFSENGYYPELAHFKQLYDIIESFLTDKRTQV